MGKYQQVESLKNGKIFLLEFYYYFYDVNIKNPTSKESSYFTDGHLGQKSHSMEKVRWS